MDSTTNSGGGGGDVDEFDSRSFFAAAATAGINNTSVANRNSSRSSHFFDSLPFLEPPSSFPLLPNPPTKTPKNSKKRSRASRRAPTTVLTTDTSNFRAIVQEFTGIPAPPFSSSASAFSSSSSSYPRSRFDFFNPAINAAASSSPSSLLQPYTHKFQVPNINASGAANRGGRDSSSTKNDSNYTVVASPTSFNYQSPILNFQSLLQSQLVASGTADLAVKARQQPMMMPSTSTFTDYGVADLGLPGLIGSGWGQDASADPTQLREEVSNFCKLNFSAAAVAAAEFGAAEKGGEARGEGMVESWICSSD